MDASIGSSTDWFRLGVHNAPASRANHSHSIGNGVGFRDGMGDEEMQLALALSLSATGSHVAGTHAAPQEGLHFALHAAAEGEEGLFGMTAEADVVNVDDDSDDDLAAAIRLSMAKQ